MMELDQKIQWAIQMAVQREDMCCERKDWFEQEYAAQNIIQVTMEFMELQRKCAEEWFFKERERARKAHAKNESTPV